MIKTGVLNHFIPLWWEKDWKRCEMAKIGHSELFWTTLVEKDGKKFNWSF